MMNYYAADSIITKSEVDSIFISIDSSLSIYKPYSLITQFNQSFKGIKADTHLLKVINKSLETWRLTKGAFDIAYKSKGSQNIAVLQDAVVKTDSSVVIDVNGIAQGYTVDVIAEFLLKKGVKDFIVEVGGEIRVSGKRQPSNKPMKIEVQSPLGRKIITLNEGAITTSSNYEKNHIIDPASGEPVLNELVSVTVHAKDAITADAYDNALMVMGLRRAIKFIRKRKDLSAYFVYRNATGKYTAKASRRFRKLIDQ